MSGRDRRDACSRPLLAVPPRHALRLRQRDRPDRRGPRPPPRRHRYNTAGGDGRTFALPRSCGSNGPLGCGSWTCPSSPVPASPCGAPSPPTPRPAATERALRQKQASAAACTTDVHIAELADGEGRVVVTKDRDFRDGHLLSGSPRRLMVVRKTVVSTLSINDRTAVTARTGASADRDLGAEVPVLTRPSKRPPCASRSPGSPSGPAPSRGPTRSSWWRVCNGRSPRGSPKAGKAASAPPGGRRCVGGVRRGRGGCGWLLS
jgi:hypothetical protein